jgi:alkylated DNA repair protein alkB family protein 8
MKTNTTVQMIGIDRCLPLLDIAQEKNRNRNFLRADAVKLPIRSECFDAFICIAVLHHFSIESMRLSIIK